MSTGSRRWAVALAAAGCLSSALGCAAPQRPALESLIASDQAVKACAQFAYAGGFNATPAEIRARRAGTRLVGARNHTTLTLSVETLDAANARLGAPMLFGDLVPLTVHIVSEGPHSEMTILALSVREDGTRWESIAGHRTLHDTLGRVFGDRPRPAESGEERTAADSLLSLHPSVDESRHSQRTFESMEESCRSLSKMPCTAWVPLARTAPSVGAEEIVFDLRLWLKDGDESCPLELRHTVPLPAGPTLAAKLTALAARGPIVVSWSE